MRPRRKREPEINFRCAAEVKCEIWNLLLAMQRDPEEKQGKTEGDGEGPNNIYVIKLKSMCNIRWRLNKFS